MMKVATAHKPRFLKPKIPPFSTVEVVIILFRAVRYRPRIPFSTHKKQTKRSQKSSFVGNQCPFSSDLPPLPAAAAVPDKLASKFRCPCATGK